jgi:tRNA A-37 threonylcarbamoyl transferase component Bud32
MEPMKMTADFYIREDIINNEEYSDTEKFENIINVIEELLELLDILHKNKYFHGDTHLNNFMLSNENEWKIIDFGTSNIISDELDILIDYDTLNTNLRIILEENNMNMMYEDIKTYLLKKYKIFTKVFE